MESDAIRKELLAIAAKHGGNLNPADVVEFARDPETALHDRFTWDDDEAAQRWRLHEARNIIRVVVHILPNTDETPRRVFVSLRQDRDGETGYRPLAKVMADDELRAMLLEDAIADMQYFRAKYADLKQLSGVFAEMERVASAAPQRKTVKVRAVKGQPAPMHV